MTEIRITTTIYSDCKTCFDLSRSIDLHLSSMKHTGEKVVGGRRAGLCEEGDFVTWEARHFGWTFRLTSRITVMRQFAHFQDVMVAGPFTFMEHDHFFQDSFSGTTMTDVFRYKVPLGWVGEIFDQLVLRKYMTELLRSRNQMIQCVAEAEFSHKKNE